MKVLNFWRSTFDRWLDDLAVVEGADNPIYLESSPEV